MVSGAAIIIVVASTTSIWTCWTSLVMRVISDGAPKWPTSRAEYVGHLVEQVAADVAAEAHRHLGAEPHGGAGEHDLHEAEGEHDRALRARCSRCRR